MSNELLVERLARVLYEAEPHLSGGEPLTWASLTDQYKGRYRARVGVIMLEVTAAGMVIVPREPTQQG